MNAKKKLQGKEFLSKYKKTIFIIGLVILATGFIPFERTPGKGLRESVVSFPSGVNYKEKAYYERDHYGYGECLYDAKYSSYGKDDEDRVYRELKDKCEKSNFVDAEKAINRLVLYDGVKVTVGGEYGRKDLFIGEDGKLYGNYAVQIESKDKYKIVYSEPVDFEVISGSGITITARFTVTCRAFGLICDDEHTNMHQTLTVGKNATVNKYSKTCAYYSQEYLLDGSGECIYKNDTPTEVKISTILNQ